MIEQKIEFETVPVRVPKLIMAFLRAYEKSMGMTAKEYIEYNIVDSLRADVAALDTFITPKEVADNWKLNPIFKTIVNDEVI